MLTYFSLKEPCRSVVSNLFGIRYWCSCKNLMPDDLRWNWGSDASAGEWLQIQMKLLLLTSLLLTSCCVPCFLTGHGPVLVADLWSSSFTFYVAVLPNNDWNLNRFFHLGIVKLCYLTIWSFTDFLKFSNIQGGRPFSESTKSVQ